MPGNLSTFTGIPNFPNRCAYASPSSHRGSNSAVSTSVLGRPDRSVALIGAAYGLSTSSFAGSDSTTRFLPLSSTRILLHTLYAIYCQTDNLLPDKVGSGSLTLDRCDPESSMQPQQPSFLPHCRHTRR